MLATDYPLLDVFWSMLFLFLWIAWLLLVFRVIGDVFSNPDMKGVMKAVWLIAVILVPWLGVLVYLITNGEAMNARAVERGRAAQDEFAKYVRDTAGSGGGSADELAKLAELRDNGVLTEEEFASQKAKILS